MEYSNKWIDISQFRISMSYPKNQYDEVNEWVHNEEANCYQFATTSVCFVDGGNLMPGQLSGHQFPVSYRYTDEELMKYVAEDFKVLGYSAVPCDEGYKFATGEWKIAVLNCDTKGLKYDFHFLRQLAENDSWLQKYAWDQHPRGTDLVGRLIRNPEKAKFFYPYHVVGYFVIRKKK